MRKNPTISVNKLGEYIVGRAALHRTLLRNRKYPDSDFTLGLFHRESRGAIRDYLADGALDATSVESALRALEQQSPTKTGTARRICSNIKRLTGFLEMLDDIDLKGAETEVGPNSGSMKIGNVEVSVRPEVILRGKGTKGRRLVGALKLQMSGSSPFNAEAAGYVSAAVQEFCRRTLVTGDEVVYAPYCQVIDVGNRRIHPGVKSTAQRMRDIEAACLNIAALWPSI